MKEDYPSKEELDNIINWRYVDYESAVELAEYIVSLWHWEHMATIKGKKVKILTLITGGWSGNEEIIGAIEKNVLFPMLYWQKSERGGLHIYKIER